MYSVCAGCLLPSPAKTTCLVVIMTTVVSGSLLSPFHRNLETPNVTAGRGTGTVRGARAPPCLGKLTAAPGDG
jgi:hypothetical protein